MASEELYHDPPVQTPSISKLRDIAVQLGMDNMSDDDLKVYQDHMSKNTLKGYSTVYKYPEPKLPVKYPRTPGYRPSQEENKFNAWYYKTEIKGAAGGKLAGKRIAIKDNIPVAGVPMMNGSNMLEGYTPEFDATVVTRILDHGGEIGGKAVCENFCCHSHSWTASTGPVLNPHEPTRSASGSSSGSAVLVALGEVDMALGGDQAGSIRMPASWCGVVGLKPTYGLVPYTGIASIEFSVDHVGPMARTVKDCALLLEAIAGYDDGLDARQPRDIEVPAYTKLLTGKLTGMKVGVIKEAFEGCQGEVEPVVKAAAQLMTKAGATVEEVSIPIHRDVQDFAMPVYVDGIYNNMVLGAESGIGWKGFYPTSLIKASDKAYKSRVNDLPSGVKMFMMLGEYMKQKYGVEHYARAMNVGRLATEAYNKALKTYDVLVLPTTKFTALKLPTAELSLKGELELSLPDNFANTCGFDITGHPALSVNAGTSDGMPVGLSIVGRHFEDGTVLKVAHAFEQLRDAK